MDRGKIKSLAAGEDGHRDLLRFRRAENEFHVFGRFLKRLQERVKGLASQHVDFINDVDFVTGAAGANIGVGAKLSDLLDPPIAGSIEFQYIDILTKRNGLANIAFIARRDGWTLVAIQALGKDPRRGRFPDSPCAGEQIGVPNPVLSYRIGEGLGDMPLTDQVGE
jgi:hypothetical protein